MYIPKYIQNFFERNQTSKTNFNSTFLTWFSEPTRPIEQEEDNILDRLRAEIRQGINLRKTAPSSGWFQRYVQRAAWFKNQFILAKYWKTCKYIVNQSCLITMKVFETRRVHWLEILILRDISCVDTSWSVLFGREENPIVCK